MKIDDLLETAAERLMPFSDTPQLDAQVLLANIVNRPRTWVAAHGGITLTTEQHRELDGSLVRLERGEPFPYVLGRWEFFGLEFEVTRDVLIPRPETELLVEKAIARLRSRALPCMVADIGTGCGAIAVSIAMQVPRARILATDISRAALGVAQRNARKFAVEKQIEFVECDLLPDGRPQTADHSASSINLICANLPYIPTETLRKLPIYDREPTLALDGGADGLELYRRLFNLAPDRLVPDGQMLCEIESSLGRQAMALATGNFPNAAIRLYQDLAGKDRILEITLP